MSAARKMARARQRAADKPVEARLRATGRLEKAHFIRRGLVAEHGQRVTLADVERFLDLPEDVRGEFDGSAPEELSEAAWEALSLAE